jgi:hypothetical protein
MESSGLHHLETMSRPNREPGGLGVFSQEDSPTSLKSSPVDTILKPNGILGRLGARGWHLSQ